MDDKNANTGLRHGQANQGPRRRAAPKNTRGELDGSSQTSKETSAGSSMEARPREKDGSGHCMSGSRPSESTASNHAASPSRRNRGKKADFDMSEYSASRGSSPEPGLTNTDPAPGHIAEGSSFHSSSTSSSGMKPKLGGLFRPTRQGHQRPRVGEKTEIEGLRVHSTSSSSGQTDTSEGGVLLPEIKVDVQNLRRAGSVSKPPKLRRISVSSSHTSSGLPAVHQPALLHEKIQEVNVHSASVNRAPVHSLKADRSDPSLSSLSIIEEKKERSQTLRGKVFNVAKKARRKSSKFKDEKKAEKRERMKEKIKSNLVKTKDILKPMGHDIVETTGTYGRMLAPISSLLAPAALLTLWAWDAVQYVETNRGACEGLIEAAADQHAKLMELIRIALRHKSLTEDDEAFIIEALKAHKDACRAVYDKVIMQKNQSYIVRFIKRKTIDEQVITGERGKLSSAALAFTNALTAMTVANAADTHKTIKDLRQILSKSVIIIDRKDLEGPLSRIIPEPDRLAAEIDIFMERRKLQEINDTTEERKQEIKDLKKLIEGIKDMFEQLLSIPEGKKALQALTNTESEARAEMIQLENKQRGGPLTDEEGHGLNILRLKVNLYKKILALQRERQKNQVRNRSTQTDPELFPALFLPHLNVDEADRATESRSSSRARSSKLYASVFQDYLLQNFSPSLKEGLWTPTVVKVGYVGHIDKTRGEFKFLFDATKAKSTGALTHLDPFPRKAKHDYSKLAQKTASRDAITKHSRWTLNRRISKIRKEDTKKFKQSVKNMYKMANSRAPKRAFLVVKEPKHVGYGSNDLGDIKRWFDKSIDEILKAFRHEQCGTLRREDIILVTETLSAKRWGLMVTLKDIPEQLYFCEFADAPRSTYWGAFSIEQSEDFEQGTDYATKTSQYDPERAQDEWDSILLARLRFTDGSGSCSEE